MKFVKKVFYSFTKKERMALFITSVAFVFSLIGYSWIFVKKESEFVPVQGGSYKEGVVGQPIIINPIFSDNQTDQDIGTLLFAHLSDLIDTYQIEENGIVYVINLKENLVWDNDKPLTSDDVVFTIETAQNPNLNSPYRKNWQGVVVERISELQVRLTLPARYSFFEENMERLPIIPKHIFGNIPPENISFSSYNFEPVGSGPYSFKDFSQRKDGFITEYNLVANDKYVHQRPFISEFSFKFYENEEELLKAFRLREIDGFGTSGTIDSKTINESSQIKIERIQMSRYYAVFFNQNNNAALGEKSIRYALALATPKDRIINEIFGENAKKINGPLFFDYDNAEISIEYNPEQAKEFIQKSKFKEITLNLVVPKIDFLEKTAEILKSEWISAGISDVKIIKLEPKDIIEKTIKTNNYELLLFGNILENQKDMFPFWHSSQRMYPGLNLSFYKNTEVDKLIETIRETGDKEKISIYANSVARTITNDVPAIFLFSLPYTYVHESELGNFFFKDSEDKILVTPSDRFIDIEKWYVIKARVLKDD